MGDITFGNVLEYFYKVDENDRLVALQSGNIVNYRLPSYGRFYVALQAKMFFGVPRIVTFPGPEMDVDYLVQHADAKDASSTARIAYSQNIGAASSAFEHIIPEKFFAHQVSGEQPEAVSAVKAINIAMAQGQKIYKLNTGNKNLHASALQQMTIPIEIKNEIALALSLGKEVNVHEKSIQVFDWQGVGYIVIDPETGGGAYKIAGGGNGSKLSAKVAGAVHGLLTGLAVGGLVSAGATMGLFPLFIFLCMLVVLTVVITAIMSQFYTQENFGCYINAFSTTFGLGIAKSIDLVKGILVSIGAGEIVDSPPGWKCYSTNN